MNMKMKKKKKKKKQKKKEKKCWGEEVTISSSLEGFPKRLAVESVRTSGSFYIFSEMKEGEGQQVIITIRKELGESREYDESE